MNFTLCFRLNFNAELVISNVLEGDEKEDTGSLFSQGVLIDNPN